MGAAVVATMRSSPWPARRIMTFPDDSPESRTAIELARSLFLRDDNNYGCAESAMVALQELYGLPDAADSSAAMVLNGGVAYSGGVCGAISGAALAVGKLAGGRIADHRRAKRTARRLVQLVMAEFEDEFGSNNCSDLIDYDLTTQHDEFIESGVWKGTCMKQIEFAVARLHSLADPVIWDEMLRTLDVE